MLDDTFVLLECGHWIQWKYTVCNVGDSVVCNLVHTSNSPKHVGDDLVTNLQTTVLHKFKLLDTSAFAEQIKEKNDS